MFAPTAAVLSADQNVTGPLNEQLHPRMKRFETEDSVGWMTVAEQALQPGLDPAAELAWTQVEQGQSESEHVASAAPDNWVVHQHGVARDAYDGVERKAAERESTAEREGANAPVEKALHADAKETCCSRAADPVECSDAGSATVAAEIAAVAAQMTKMQIDLKRFGEQDWWWRASLSVKKRLASPCEIE